MNKLKWMTNALAALMIVLAALGALCGAVAQKAYDTQFYNSMSRRAVMDTLNVTDTADAPLQTTAYIGLTEAEQTALAQEMVLFMKGEINVLPDALSEREQQHMLDVRGLVALAQKVSQACMTIAAGLAVVIAWTGVKEKRRGMPFGVLVGMLIVATAAGLVYVLLNAKGFEALFIRFHELFFTNDLWMMNPETDVLIRMMPQLLFERAGKDVAGRALQTFMIVDVMLCTVYFIVGGMIRRNLTEREKQ